MSVVLLRGASARETNCRFELIVSLDGIIWQAAAEAGLQSTHSLGSSSDFGFHELFPVGRSTSGSVEAVAACIGAGKRAAPVSACIPEPDSIVLLMLSLCLAGVARTRRESVRDRRWLVD